MPVAADKYQKIEIIERRDYGPELWSIRARAEEKLNFKPGQYATLAVERNNRMIQRAYSIVSSPLEDELEFFFELVPQVELTPLLFKALVGDSIWMRRQARGRFTLDANSGHNRHFLLATVTGVAPYVSIVRTAIDAFNHGMSPENQMVVIQAASRSWEFAYCDELRSLASSCGWLRYIPSVSRPWEDPDWKGETGRVEDIARKYLDAFEFTPSNSTAYLCGHPQMIENCKGILKRSGFSRDFVREEIYWIPAKAARLETQPTLSV
ncbi:MAG: ferredoxin--NADP reductase [Acidobacteriota bacterium]|nr:ferredoxin--NADP reductase [Acidobacteriota bacterium]